MSAPMEFVRLDPDDSEGRGEPTVWYRHPEYGLCYVWLKLLKADNPLRIAAVATLGTPPTTERTCSACATWRDADKGSAWPWPCHLCGRTGRAPE